MVSTLTQRGKQITMDALQAGALDFVAKPGGDVAHGLQLMLQELRDKVKIISCANVSQWRDSKYRPPKSGMESGKHALPVCTEKVLAIGASTGGPEAIRTILQQLPATIPATVIVQHMPAGFTNMFARSLNEQCKMMVKEAENGDQLTVGNVMIAPGDCQMRVVRCGRNYTVVCNPGEKVNGYCPSVDVLFQSVAENVAANAVGIMLTGMGDDGAGGMLAMHRAGAQTMAQDEATSVVFGMPKKAYEFGATDKLVPLHAIPQRILSLLPERS
jgi:two-component system chemotaxis response regulator CheB